MNELFAAFIALLFLLAGALVLLDSAPGHRFIVDRIARFETASGLNIRIGRIDGSIFGKSQLRNVTIADQHGVFLTSPNIKLDWAPGAWLYNKLSIDSLTAERGPLIRLPKLKPSTKKGPILPGFDIHIGELRVDRLDVGAQVGGVPRSGSVRGKADVHSGRALIELAAVMNNGGDRVTFHLDAEPDRNKFDVRAHVASPDERAGPGDHRARTVRSSSISAERAAGRGGGEAPRSTSPAGRQRGSRWASTAAGTGSRGNGRRRSSSPASFSA